MHSDCLVTVDHFPSSVACFLLHESTRRPLKRIYFSIVRNEKRLLLKRTQNYVVYSVSWSGRVSKGPRLRIQASRCLVIKDELTQLWHIYSPVYSVASNDHHEELYTSNNITKYVMLCTKRHTKLFQFSDYNYIKICI